MTKQTIDQEYDAMEKTFGDEWRNLSPMHHVLVRRDYFLEENQDDCTLAEYRRRIGRGNLQAYADVLEAGARRKAGYAVQS